MTCPPRLIDTYATSLQQQVRNRNHPPVILQLRKRWSRFATHEEFLVVLADSPWIDKRLLQAHRRSGASLLEFPLNDELHGTNLVLSL
jgi:hypothetical protein